MFRVLLKLKFYSTSINLSSKEEETTNKILFGQRKTLYCQAHTGRYKRRPFYQ
ncbi:hypothetical protein NC651_020510 [Populus alba x Populus x berolinensis]|nr:hypothetical protein NC651_020510 [Populus alba x Populus x berolinensis]